MNIRKIGLRLRDYLRDEVPDPIRRDGQWIHLSRIPDDISNIGKTPVIYIHRDESPSSHDTVGGEQHAFLRYDINIVCRNKDTGNVDGERADHSDELMELLVQKVIDKMASVNSTIDSQFHDGNTYIHAIQRRNIGGVFPISDTLSNNLMSYEVVPV